MNRPYRILAWLPVVLAVAGSAAGADAPPEVPVPPGVATDRPRELPGAKDIPWQVVVVNDRIELFAGPGDAEPMALPADRRPAYGERVYVLAEVTLPRRRVLLARFDREAERWVLRRVLGWAAPEWVFENERGLTSNQALEYLRKVLPPDDPRWAWIRRMLPDVTVREHGDVNLKLFIGDEKGSRAYRWPAAPGEPGTGTGAAAGEPLLPFTFLYVHKIVAQRRTLHVLVSHRADLEVAGTDRGDFALDVPGWCEITAGGELLWATRVAARPDTDPKVRHHRVAGGHPIKVFVERSEAVADLLGTPGPSGKPPVPLWVESENGRYWVGNWDDGWHCFPILGATTARDATGVNRNIIQLAVLGTRDDLGSGPAYEYLKDLEKIREQLRTIEICIVLDRTGSMSVSFPAVVRAVRSLVEELGRRGRDGELVPVRVAVVGFFDRGGSTPVVDPSPGFFEVTSPEGLDAFSRYVGSLTSLEGGDRYEAHLTAIEHAMQSFLKSREAGAGGADAGRSHRPGAARVALVISDTGPHVKGENGETLTADLVTAQAEIVKGKDREGHDAQSAGIAVYGLLVKHRPGETDTRWKDVIGPVVKETGGSLHEVGFHGGAADRAPDELRDVLIKLVEDRRKKTRDQVAAMRRRLVDHDAVVDVDWHAVHPRIREIVTPARWEQIEKGLARSFFFTGYTPDATPDDPPDHPRFRKTVLLTYEDYTRIQNACERIATELRPVVKSLSRAKPGDDVQKQFKRAVVPILLGVLGGLDEVPEAELRRYEKMTMEEIQARVKTIPVTIHALRGQGPTTFAEVEALHSELTAAAGRMKRLVFEHPKRFLRVAIDGQRHVYLGDDELP